MSKRRSHKKKYILVLISLLLLVTATVALADSQQFRSDGVVVVDQAEPVKGPVFYTGSQVHVSSRIDGMAFIAGGEITIDGIVRGDLFVAGQKVIINGQILGDLYGAASQIQVNGQVNGDAMLAGERVHGAQGSSFGRDVLAAGSTVFLSGNIDRQLFAGGRNIVLDGVIGDNSRLASDTLEVRKTAVVEGDLVYRSAKEASIDTDAAIAGDVRWEVVESGEQTAALSREGIMQELRSQSIAIAAALIVWYIVILLVPGFWVRVSGTLRTAPLQSIVIGLLALVVTPFFAVIALITVIGAPLAMIALATYGVSLYITKIIVAVAIGYAIVAKYSWRDKHNGLWSTILGLVVLAVLSVIPVVGMLVSLIALFGGLGALLIYLFNRNKKSDPAEEVFVDA